VEHVSHSQSVPLAKRGYLAQHTETDPALVPFTLQDPAVNFAEFTTLAGAVFRGTHDYGTVLKIIRRAKKEAAGPK